MIDKRRGKWIVVGSLGLLLVATVAVTWPLILHLDTHVVGHVDHPGLQGDLFFQWNLDRQMEEGSLDHLASRHTLHPVGERFRAKVAFSLHLALYVLLMLVFDLITAHNVAVLSILVANAAAAWMLFRERVQSAGFALACALLFAFGPWVQLKLDQGFVQKITLFHLPLFVLFLLRVLEHRRWRDAVLCAFFLVVGALVYPPFAAFDVLLALVLVTAFAARRTVAGRLLPLLGGLAVVVVLVVLAVWMVGSKDFLLGDRMSVGTGEFRSQGGYLDLFHLVRCFPYVGTFGDRPFHTIVERLPLGLPLVPLGLAVVAVIVRRRYAPWLLATTGALVLVMAGPYLMRSGDLVMIGDRAVPLPFLLLERLPFSQVLRFPIRLFPWVLVAILLASCEAIDWVQERVEHCPGRTPWAAVLPVIAAALMLAEPLLVFPEYRGFHIEKIRSPSYCEVVGTGEGAALLHLPYYPPGPHDYLMAAVLCDRPIVNPWSWKPPPMTIPEPGAPPEMIDTFVDGLNGAGVVAVVVHPGAYDFYASHPDLMEPSLGMTQRLGGGADVESWLEERLGPPIVYADDRAHVYLLGKDNTRE